MDVILIAVFTEAVNHNNTDSNTMNSRCYDNNLITYVNAVQSRKVNRLQWSSNNNVTDSSEYNHVNSQSKVINLFIRDNTLTSQSKMSMDMRYFQINSHNGRLEYS